MDHNKTIPKNSYTSQLLFHKAQTILSYETQHIHHCHVHGRAKNQFCWSKVPEKNEGGGGCEREREREREREEVPCMCVCEREREKSLTLS